MRHFICSVERKFDRKVFNSLSEFFSFSLNFPWRAGLVCCRAESVVSRNVRIVWGANLVWKPEVACSCLFIGQFFSHTHEHILFLIMKACFFTKIKEYWSLWSSFRNKLRFKMELEPIFVFDVFFREKGKIVHFITKIGEKNWISDKKFYT